MLTVVAALIGILVGAIGGAVLMITLSRSRVRLAEATRRRILADTERESEAVRREAQIEAREQVVKLRSDIEAEVQDKRLQIVKLEERVLQKEEEIDAKLTDLERREQGLGDREVHAKALQEELKHARDEALAELQRLSGLTVHEAKQQLLERSKDLVRHELAREVR